MESDMEIKIEQQHLYILQFTNDQEVIVNDKENMGYVIRQLIGEYKQYGPTVNIEITRYLCIGDEYENLNLENYDIIVVCSNYIYLDSIFNKEG